MHVYDLKVEQTLPISREEAWQFFSSPRNLDEITPKNLGFKITYMSSPNMYEGEIITYKIRMMPMVWISWVTEIKSVKEGESFIDQQLSGPYKLWHHLHQFEETSEGVKMTDLVHYSIGFGPLDPIINKLYIKKKLNRIFQYRREVLSQKFSD